jgi:hypothetical protein
MPEIIFRKPVTEKQFELLKEMAKRNNLSIDDYLWLCIRSGVEGDVDVAYDTSHPQRDKMLAQWGPNRV